MINTHLYGTDLESLRRFTEQLARDAKSEIERLQKEIETLKKET